MEIDILLNISATKDIKINLETFDVNKWRLMELNCRKVLRFANSLYRKSAFGSLESFDDENIIISLANTQLHQIPSLLNSYGWEYSKSNS